MIFSTKKEQTNIQREFAAKAKSANNQNFSWKRKESADKTGKQQQQLDILTEGGPSGPKLVNCPLDDIVSPLQLCRQGRVLFAKFLVLLNQKRANEQGEAKKKKERKSERKGLTSWRSMLMFSF